MTDSTSFESVIRDARPALVRYVGRLVGEVDAEDVSQVALSKAASAWSDFRGEASPRSWLFRIATNTAHDWNRARRATVRELVETAEDELGAGGAEDASQERRLVREEMSQCVGEVLGRLPEGYQVVLALSDCEELSDREVAAVLGVTLGAVKIRLHRARTKLKQELSATCSFYHDAENTLCCDRKEKSTERAYPSEGPSRHQVSSRTSGVPFTPSQESTMTAVETLPTKQKHLIGIGAAVAAGCHPCTRSFVSAAREAGACDRGVRFALEIGLLGREAAMGATQAFADQTFARPELDSAFRAERALLESLIAVAAAVASNAASLLASRVGEARALGATDDQIRLAAQIARTARRGAENATEAELGAVLGDATGSRCCGEEGAEPSGEAPQPCEAGASTKGACGCAPRVEPA